MGKIAGIGACAIAALVILGGSLPGLGAAAAASDRIAFQCGSDLCLMDPDSPASIVNLTQTPMATEYAPSWSPDGNTIAFQADYNGGLDVFTTDANAAPGTGEATNVSQTTDRSEGARIGWSPDGQRLTYEAFYNSNLPPNLGADVFVSPADGSSAPLPIGSSTAQELYPTFSPDGTKIAFSRNGATFIAPSNGTGTATSLVGGGSEPAWSPDGTRIATIVLNFPYKLRVTSANGSGGSVDLTELASGYERPSWSPDSRRVAYIKRENTSGNTSVRVAPADNSNPGVEIPMPPGWIVPHAPVFSPDGTRVAFTARYDTGPGYNQILLAPADGSAVAVPITTAAAEHRSVAWKPGGTGPLSPSGPSSPGGEGGSQNPGTPTRPVQKFSFALFRQPALVNNFVKVLWVDCKMAGGTPSQLVREVCSFHADGFAKGVAPQVAPRPRWRPRPKPRRVLFARGDVKVPVGKTKPLPLKLTAAGRKLVKPGRTLKLEVRVRQSRKGSKVQVMTKTVTLKIAGKR